MINPTTAFPDPLYQNVAFNYSSADEMAAVFAGRSPGFLYSRISNPTTYALESRLSAMDDGIGSIVTASGMAAISTICFGLLRPGDEIVVLRGIFGGTVSLFTHLLRRMGIQTHFIDAEDTAALSAAITPRTRMLFLETISNPSMDVPDIKAWSHIAGNAGIPLIVDATVTTPALAGGKGLGADLVLYSTTKFINGHGNALGGAIIDTGRYDWGASPFEDVRYWADKAGKLGFIAYLRNVIHRDVGACLSPTNAWLTLQGLETLHIRMHTACRNALHLAGFLAEQCPSVLSVKYPGLDNSPYRARIQTQFGGYGGAILTFDLGSKEAAFNCLNRLRLVKRMTNLGDVHTLAIHPASTIFAEFPESERLSLGAPDGGIRVSMGLEDADNICRDFAQALKI